MLKVENIAGDRSSPSPPVPPPMNVRSNHFIIPHLSMPAQSESSLKQPIHFSKKLMPIQAYMCIVHLHTQRILQSPLPPHTCLQDHALPPGASIELRDVCTASQPGYGPTHVPGHQLVANSKSPALDCVTRNVGQRQEQTGHGDLVRRPPDSAKASRVSEVVVMLRCQRQRVHEVTPTSETSDPFWCWLSVSLHLLLVCDAFFQNAHLIQDRIIAE